MNKARQECEPQSGLLIANELRMESSLADKKSRAKNLDDSMQSNPYVMAELAKVAWMERKLDKARKYLALALAEERGREDGDLWALRYKVEKAIEEEKGEDPFDEAAFREQIKNA